MTTIINLKKSISSKAPTFVISNRYHEQIVEQTPGQGFYNVIKISKRTLSPMFKKHILDDETKQLQVGKDLLPPIKFKSQLSPAYYSPKNSIPIKQYTIQSKYYQKYVCQHFLPGPQTYYKQSSHTSPGISIKFRPFQHEQAATPSSDLYQSTINKNQK
ncbi:hypothetical protein SS50377_24712 [Spironucleus salmonicida]|uniref:SHIPPO 1-like protein n=1 Tax=Spironucleus salmonicida TaxID=348837 RepID=V6LJN7_9EUKA|nr:hypothetical protein SS50377_24712 [Spironucleus salmonicida]|eukprot:EST44593.1 Hypothetical protein SS50377_15598 [Spironucleus salmonicida]